MVLVNYLSRLNIMENLMRIVYARLDWLDNLYIVPGKHVYL